MSQNTTAQEKGLSASQAADLPRKISSVSWKYIWHKETVMVGILLYPSWD